MRGVNWKKTELSSSALGEEFKSFGYCNYRAEGRRGEARQGSLGPNLDNIRAHRIRHQASGISFRSVAAPNGANGQLRV